MAASSSAALRRTSSTMACSSSMASRVAVCRAFTAWEQGGLSPAGGAHPRPRCRCRALPRSPAPPAPAARSPACRLTRGPRSALGSPCGERAREPRSRPPFSPLTSCSLYPPLHVPEAADAQQRLLVGGEHDVGLGVQRCGGSSGEGSGQARPRPAPAIPATGPRHTGPCPVRRTHCTSGARRGCARPEPRCRGARTCVPGAFRRGSARTAAAHTCCRSTWSLHPKEGGSAQPQPAHPLGSLSPHLSLSKSVSAWGRQVALGILFVGS